jgi:hypothetical protein
MIPFSSVRGHQASKENVEKGNVPLKVNGEAVRQAVERLCSKMTNVVGKDAVAQLLDPITPYAKEIAAANPKSNLAELRYVFSLIVF